MRVLDDLSVHCVRLNELYWRAYVRVKLHGRHGHLLVLGPTLWVSQARLTATMGLIEVLSHCYLVRGSGAEVL